MALRSPSFANTSSNSKRGAEERLLARARDAGVGIGALRPYYAKNPTMRGLMFGYGNLDERAIDEGLERLRTAMSSSFRRQIR